MSMHQHSPTAVHGSERRARRSIGYIGVVEWLQPVLLVVAIGVAAWLALLAVLWLNRPTRELVGPAARLLPDLARLVRSLLSDRTTPGSVRFALAFLLGWIVSPIDLIPEFIPVLGPLDDLIVACLVLRWAGRRMGRSWIRGHWQGSPEGLALLERLL
jgi:uncharacterized membrane protein YkvA (DUF1232 family)